MKLAEKVIIIFFVAAPAAITYSNIFECGRGKEKPKALCAFKCAEMCVGKEVKQN